MRVIKIKGHGIKLMDDAGNEIKGISKIPMRIDAEMVIPDEIDFSTMTFVDGVIVEDAALKAKKDLKDIEALVLVAYKAMVGDVYDQMETVFGTRNDVSASAFAATYEAMIKRPASYVDAALGFANEAAVTAYASAKIATSDAYGVFRMKRIAQYQAEKTAIEGA